MGDFSEKIIEKIITHILCSLFFFFFRKSWLLWHNVEKCRRFRQVTVGYILRRLHIACWITKTTDTHSEYVILIAFPLQEWLREWPSTVYVKTYIPSTAYFFNDHYLLRTNNLANSLKVACEWCIYLVPFILEHLKSHTSYVTRHFASQDSRQCAGARLSVAAVSIQTSQSHSSEIHPLECGVSDHLPRGRWA